MSTTHETIDDFYDAVHTEAMLVMTPDHEVWQAWETEDGDWFAVRPRNEEDPEGDIRDRWRPVGPRNLETLAFPITVAPALDAFRLDEYAGKAAEQARSDAAWLANLDRQGGA